MRIAWRGSAYSAVAAFLLSVLIGVIGGAGLGVILLRASIVAVLFGAGAVAVVFVIDRFLPELRQAAAPDTGGGAHVDILLDDEAAEDEAYPREELELAPEAELQEDAVEAETADQEDPQELEEVADEETSHENSPAAGKDVEEDARLMARAIRTVLKREG